LRRGGPTVELAKIQEQIAEVADDKFSQAAYLIRAAETFEAIGLPAESVQRFARAASTLPGYVHVRQSWHDTAATNGLWTDVAEAAKQTAELCTEPLVAAALHRYAGVTLMDKANDRVQAAVELRRALAISPDDGESFRRLRTVYEADDANDQLEGLLAPRLEHETDSAAKIELHRSLAELAAGRGQRDVAIQHYRAVLRADAADVRAHAAIAELAGDGRNWQDASDAVRARLQLERDPRVLRTLWRRLATLVGDHDPPQALDALHQALALKANDLDALTQLVDLAIQRADWQLALQSYDRVVVHERDPKKLALHLHRAAVIFACGLGDAPRAVKTIRLAIEQDPSDGCLELIGKLYASVTDPAALPRHLDAIVEAMRARVLADPHDAAAYRVASRALAVGVERAGQRWQVPARAAAELTDVLGAADVPERRLLSRPPRHELAWLASGEADHLVFEGSLQPRLRGILRLAGGAIARALGNDLAAYGLARRDRLAVDDPVAQIAGEVATGLGFDALDIYLARKQPTLMTVEPSSPPSLIVGAAIAQGDPLAIRFAVGAALTLAALSLSIPARLPRDQLASLVLAVMRTTRADVAGEAVDVRAADALAAKLRKVLRADQLEELVALARPLTATDIAQLAEDLSVGTLRAGYFASGSVLPGLAAAAPGEAGARKDVLGMPLVRRFVASIISARTPSGG
jgi:tetratricopeptide (TPR) repeat protein